MLRSHLLPALRNLLKNKVFAVIHISGLVIGISAFSIIQLYITYEKSFDLFHSNKNQIFRLQQDRYNQGELTLSTVGVNAGAGPALVKNFPEVKRYVQLYKLPSIIQYKDIGFKEERVAFASKDFFKIFSFDLLKGNDSLVLNEPYSVVLSETSAKRYFKNIDPIGQLIKFRGRFELKVTGIYADMPENSHFKFDMLVSFDTYFKFSSQTIKWVQEEPWRWDGYHTYVLLYDGVNADQLQEKFPKMIKSETGDWLKETGQEMKLSLQPLRDIHLSSAFNNELEPNGDLKNINYLQIIAFFILGIAWINYMSLTTAKSAERGKEVGIKKVLGSSRRQLLMQFITEAFLMNLIAIVISMLLMILMMPNFNNLINRNLNIFNVWSHNVWIFAALMLLAGTLMSGFYPAFILSSFQPTLVLKGNFQESARGKLLRKIFIVFPFTIAIILVSCLFIIYTQISFLRNLELGFSLEQKLVIRDSEVYDSSYSSRLASFKTELLNLPDVERVTYVANIPGDPLISYANSVRRLSAGEKDVNQYKYTSIDENFMDVYNLHILAGRNFTQESLPNKEVLVNEKACRLLGFSNFEEAINEKIFFRDDTVRILGVINDFHHEYPKSPLQPMIFVFNPTAGFFFVVPVQIRRSARVISQVNDLFAQIFPGQPFSYFFLDDKYDNQYKSELQFSRILGLFSILLLIITGLGLFSLSTYSATVRTKEIGIRKVLGASQTKIIMMFFREYFVLVAIACALAVPVSWYLIENWLEGFAKKIEIDAMLFTIPCGLIIAFTVLTISFQTIKIALTNPAQTLRQE